LGYFEPLNVIIHHRDPQKAHPCVNLRFLSYQLHSIGQTMTQKYNIHTFIALRITNRTRQKEAQLSQRGRTTVCMSLKP